MIAPLSLLNILVLSPIQGFRVKNVALRQAGKVGEKKLEKNSIFFFFENSVHSQVKADKDQRGRFFNFLSALLVLACLLYDPVLLGDVGHSLLGVADDRLRALSGWYRY